MDIFKKLLENPSLPIIPYTEYIRNMDSTYKPENSSPYQRFSADIAERAMNIAGQPVPQLTATMYLDFSRNGNRTRYENSYFARRTNALILAQAAFLNMRAGNENPAVSDKLVDYLWAVCEESTWIVPAHLHAPAAYEFSSSLENDDVKHIDLFSAATGGEIAWIWYMTKGVSGDIIENVRKRLYNQLYLRIIHPFITYNHDHWMGAHGNGGLNNWTPWIVSNILTVTALCVSDGELRNRIVNKCVTILDRFVSPYPNDGGCDEGPGYWNVAGGSLFDCLEILYGMSGGRISLFDDPDVKKICEYIMNVNISGNRYVNFADAASRLNPDFRMIYRMGQKINSPELCEFACSIKNNSSEFPVFTNSTYRCFENMLQEVPDGSGFVPRNPIYYPDLQIAITRKDGFFLAFKGGTNNESHNHNDIGQFILYDGGTPVIIDAGVETYYRDTFSSLRYTLWPMRGNYHNIAQIGQTEQQPGGSYHADTVSYDEKTGSMCLSLKNAYPEEADIIRYERTAQLNDGCAVVSDSISLGNPEEISFHMLTLDEPDLDNENCTISFKSGHKAVFDHSLEASCDAIDLENGKFHMSGTVNSYGA